jgi:hypothetical protein
MSDTHNIIPQNQQSPRRIDADADLAARVEDGKFDRAFAKHFTGGKPDESAIFIVVASVT